MRKVLIHLSCVGVFYCICLTVFASNGVKTEASRVVDLASHPERVTVSGKLDYLRQDQQTHTIESLIENESTNTLKWNQTSSETPAFGFGNQTYWFRLRIANTSQHGLDRLLEIKNPLLDEVLFYQVDFSGNIVNAAQTGDMKPTKDWPFYHHNLILPLYVAQHSHYYLYFKVTTSGSLVLPVALWSLDAFQERDQLTLIQFGALFGILVVMGVYNFFIYTLARDTSMLYYAAHCFCIMLFLASIHGFAAQYLWPENPWFRENALVIVGPLALYFSCLFSTSFLQLHTAYPRVHWLFMATAWCSIAILLAAFLVSYSVLIRISSALTVPVCVGSIVIGFVRWREGYSPARYFVIAWTAFLGAIVVYVLSKFAVVPQSWISEYAVLIGTVGECVLFAFALADRLSAQRKALQEAQRTALLLQKAANEKLEASVADRTKELQAANERLQALMMQDGLTGIRNRRYFDEKIQQEWQRCLRSAKSLSILLIDIDYFKDFNDQYGHLVGDECLKLVAGVIDRCVTRPSDSVARYGGEEFVVILPETDVPGALHVADNIRTSVEQCQMRVDSNLVQVTISIGVSAMIPDEQVSPHQAIALADRALYMAKSAGRNCTHVASLDLEAQL